MNNPTWKAISDFSGDRWEWSIGKIGVTLRQHSERDRRFPLRFYYSYGYGPQTLKATELEAAKVEAIARIRADLKRALREAAEPARPKETE